MKAASRALFGVAFVLSACDPTRSLQPESGDLVVAVRERHGIGNVGVGEPEVRLFLATEREYGCSNFGIAASVRVRDRTITVVAGSVIERDICLTAIGPATYQAELPVAIGEYSVRIVSGRIVDEYVLTVTADALELRPTRTQFTRPSPARSWRYPRRSLMAACVIKSFGSTGSLERCDEFRASLLAAVPLERIEFGDGGEVPYLTSSSSPGYELRVEYYRYADEGDFADVDAVIRSFGERYPGAPAWARNWRNEAHHSWLP